MCIPIPRFFRFLFGRDEYSRDEAGPLLKNASRSDYNSTCSRNHAIICENNSLTFPATDAPSRPPPRREYAYEPMAPDGRDLRLLKLLPGADTDDLEVEIIHTPFSTGAIDTLEASAYQKRGLVESPDDYDALSYVWGDPDPSEQVFVRAVAEEHSEDQLRRDDAWLEIQYITRSLAVALRHLRSLAETKTIVRVDL